MDEKDRFILESLNENSRISTAQLARTLGISRATVQNRIDRMVMTGVISRFTLALGDTQQEPAIEAMVLLKVTSADTRPLISKLRQIGGIRSLTSLNGDFDFALEIRASTTAALDEILAIIRSQPIIQDTNCSIRLRRFL